MRHLPSPSFRTLLAASCRRYPAWNAAFLLACAAMAAPAVPQAARAGEEPREPAAGLRRLNLSRAAGAQGRALDWVFERVDPERDPEWALERRAHELQKRVRAIADALLNEDRRNALEALLTPDFTGDDPAPPEEEAALTGELLQVRRARSRVSEHPLARDAWIRRLRALGARAAPVRRAALKIFRVETLAGGTKTAVRLELAGRPGAGSVQVTAVWELVWDRGQPARVRAMRLQSYERARSARLLFRDATLEAFGALDSFNAQLARGVEYWRTRIDAASGIDVYGHHGAAVGDVDGDGLEDIFVGQPAGLPNRLLRNRGDGTFEDITAASGTGILDAVAGALLVDLDNDGDLDLLAATPLAVLLFENEGGGRFRLRRGTGLEKVAERGATAMSLAAADYDLDGDLDLYVTCYVFWAGGGSKLHPSYPYPYHDAENGAPNVLFRNEGGLTFRDVTRESGAGRNNRRFSFAASWCDFDDDGDPDLYVANDFGRNNLYVNLGGGRFADRAAELGVEDRANGMSVAWGDYNCDGRFDLYVGNMWSAAGLRIAVQERFADGTLRPLYERMARGNSLFRNDGDGFSDVSLESGAWFGRWSWASVFADFDCDGDEDIYIANGFVSNDDRRDL